MASGWTSRRRRIESKQPRPVDVDKRGSEKIKTGNSCNTMHKILLAGVMIGRTSCVMRLETGRGLYAEALLEIIFWVFFFSSLFWALQRKIIRTFMVSIREWGHSVTGRLRGTSASLMATRTTYL